MKIISQFSLRDFGYNSEAWQIRVTDSVSFTSQENFIIQKNNLKKINS